MHHPAASRGPGSVDTSGSAGATVAGRCGLSGRIRRAGRIPGRSCLGQQLREARTGGQGLPASSGAGATWVAVRRRSRFAGQSPGGETWCRKFLFPVDKTFSLLLEVVPCGQPRAGRPRASGLRPALVSGPRLRIILASKPYSARSARPAAKKVFFGRRLGLKVAPSDRGGRRVGGISSPTGDATPSRSRGRLRQAVRMGPAGGE